MSDNVGSDKPADFLLYAHGKKSENKIPALEKAWSIDIVTVTSFLHMSLPLRGALLWPLPPKIY